MTTLQQVYEVTRDTRWDGTASAELHESMALNILSMLGADLPIADVDGPMIQRELVVPWKRQGLARSTINRRRSVWMAMVSEAIKLGMLGVRPTWPKEKMRVINGKKEGQNHRWLTTEETAQLIHELVFAGTPTLYMRLVQFLLFTGMRVGEALHLTWDCVDFDRKILEVGASKTGQPRSVPMTKYISTILRIQAAHRTHGEQGLFVFPGIAYRTFYRVVNSTNVPKVTPHVLRHTFATTLVRKGCPIETVSRLLGHSDINMTMRYAHHSPKQLDVARELLEEK